MVKLDLTGDTITAAALLNGYTAHDKAGEAIVGACDFNADTSGTTLGKSEALSGKKFIGADGSEVVGDMPNRGGVDGKIATKDGNYTIQQGYHDGSGSVGIDDTEKAKIIPSNIKSGIEILGVTGTMTGEEDFAVQTKSVTPSFEPQAVVPDEGYDYMSQVTVGAIPVTETPNAAGGITLTIG